MSIYDKASLVLIPSGTKTSKVYSQKPVSGDGDFTFTRSSAATRVNADGNIEKETSNLLLQSNSFDTTWVSSNTTETGGQSGYDGTSDAWLLSKTSGYANLNQSVSASGVNTYSVYAKANTLNWLRIVGGSTSAFFDLNNGVVGSTDAGNIAKMTSIGSGWYRCEVAMNASTTIMRIYPADGDNDVSGSSGSIYIQDAQLNQGLIAQEVITTTTAAVYGGITDNTPRLDYTDSSCPSLKLEPQRTNLVPFSEHLESSDWSKTRCTIEDNSTTSPEGVINASKMTSTDASESYIQDNLTTTGTKLTWSFFAKKGDLDYAHGLVWDLSANGCRQWFNLSTGAVGGTTTFGSGYSVDSATIEDYGNGWYRCAMVVNSTAGTQGCRVNISSADTTIGSAVNSYGYFYGIQLEDASHSTSYIPTYGSSVSRVVDDCDAVSATSLIGQSEGTLFLDFVANDEDSLQIIYQVRTTGSTNVGQIDFRIQSGNLRALGNDGGTGQFNISAGAAVAGTRYKCAVRYANNDVAFYVNGVLKGTDASASFASSSLDQITFNENGTTFYPSVNVNQALIIPTALPNTELADLTTL
jgi:hypothetical protein